VDIGKWKINNIDQLYNYNNVEQGDEEMHLLNLNGKWQMKRIDETQWLDAVVPGSIFRDLLANGKMEDPYYRDNENKAFELSKYDYEYKRSFTMTKEELNHDKVILRCEGLDTLCDVFVNEIKVLSAENMHRTYEVDIKKELLVGDNHIYILVKSATNYINDKDKELFNPKIPDDKPGITHIRKAVYAYGWDWGPKLGDMGIWRSISIVGYDEARIDDVYVDQKHSNDKVELDIRVGAENWSACKLSVCVTVEAPDGEVLKKTVIMDGNETHVKFEIDNPKLWWPNNLGVHPLYRVKVELLQEEKLLDTSDFRIGLRTITVKQERDQWGQSFAFTVNGESIFAMGADYIPEDAVLGNRSYERTKQLIISCAKANYNMIRVWGGGHYPEDYFYDLCDEYGIIVWQDHMYACKAYEFNDAFKENIKQETIDNVKRIRNHASIGLWCGNNEMEMLWANWGWEGRYGTKMKNDYLYQFEVFLPELTKSLDPKTFYWSASPSSFGYLIDPDNQNFGDIHYWGVWHGREPLTHYRKIHPRFNSEFGIQSFPSLKTVKTFTLPEERNIFSSVMEAHQKDGTGNEKILHYIGDNFRYPKDFDSVLFASQLAQAEGMRYGVEHWRRNRGRCMGALIWQLNDCWQVASWACIDYFNRWKATQYLARRFYAPILASVCEEGKKVEIHITNDTLAGVEGVLTWKLMKRNAEVIKEGNITVTAEKLTTQMVADLDFEDVIDENNKMNVYFAYEFIIDGKEISGGTAIFVKSKHFAYQNPEITADITETGEAFIIELNSKSYAKYVELDLEDADGIFDDNIFDMTANKVKKVRLPKDSLSHTLTLEELKKQLKVRSLYNTYE
jgi:beta-mannosidase